MNFSAVPDTWPAIALAFAMTLLAGLSTGLGGLIVALKTRPSEAFLAGSLGLSAGVMIYISLVELLPQGIADLAAAGNPHAEVWGAVAFFAGIALIGIIDRFVPEEVNPHEEPHSLDSVVHSRGLSRARMRQVGLLTAVAIAVHNFPEGFATFMVTLSDPVIAVPIALAIAIHNIPEGIAVAVPLREATGSKWKAAGWATLSGLAEPLGALIGFAVLQPFIGPQTLGLTFAGIAGVMVFVSLDKLLPTAIETGRHHTAVYGVVVGMAIMATSLVLLPG